MSDLRRLDVHVPGAAARPEDPLLAAVAGAWPAAVGPAVAREALPVRTTGGAVVVHCSSSTWAAELTLLERSVGERLAAALGVAEPPRLRFRVGELPSVAPAEPEAPPPPPLPAPARPEAAAVASRVGSADLRAAVERALSAALRDGRGAEP